MRASTGFCVITVLVLYCAVAQGLEKDRLEAVISQCQKSVKASPDVATKLIGTKKLPETAVEKCFMGCFYEGLGLIKKGAFIATAARVHANVRYGKDPEALKVALEIIDICEKTVPNEDSCVFGSALRECFIKNAKDKVENFFSRDP